MKNWKRSYQFVWSCIYDSCPLSSTL